MRLTGRSDDEPLSEAWAYLTAAEAIALLEALAVHFEEAQDVPGWHHHAGGDGAAIDERPPRTPKRRVAFAVPATLTPATPRRLAKPSGTAPGRR
jgi:hypothetical protein